MTSPMARELSSSTKATWILAILCLAKITVSQSVIPDLVYNIVEEEIIGTLLGSVFENQHLFRNLTSSQRKQLSFGILDQNNKPASLFRINDLTGEIFIAANIDRESGSCYRNAQCKLEFNVALSSSRIPFSNIATVQVNVADKNDNPPYFPAQESGRVVLDMSEWATVGTPLKLSGAADRDFDSKNTIQRYVLTDHTDMFSISASNVLDGSSVLDLTLLKPLDRETTNNYSFAIVAYDGGDPPLSASLTVVIRVIDENDNPPVFLNSTYQVLIHDEVIPNQVIIQVSASDADVGDYGKVRYRFSSLQREPLEQKFNIDVVSGEISATSTLPAGTQQFIVEALDGGNPPLKSQAFVTITVINFKNNPPFIQINTLSNGSNSFVEVSEDSMPGLFVAFISVEDNDEGPLGNVTCRLNDNILHLDTLAGKGYTLTLQETLDREAKEIYNVTVTCADMGEPPMFSAKSLLVIVTDVNDNPPVFTRNTFSLTVPEGNYSHKAILNVTAFDLDTGRNAELLYSIENAAKPLFKVDALTGLVFIQGELDRESTSLISFNVFAVDRGVNPLTGTAEIRLTLEDINDNSPTFNSSVFEFRISENTQTRTVLGRLAAYDKDVGINGMFEFYYAGSLEGSDPFMVESNGTIWSSGKLDRETRDSYSFTVMVRDKGLHPRTTYASVVVTILDANDNPPIIQFPTSTNLTIYITSYPEPDMVLGRIVAYDADADDNAKLRFSILAGNEDGAINIDPIGGEIKVKDSSRLKNRHTYKLVIRVQDRGSPHRSANTSVRVDVGFDNLTAILWNQHDDESQRSGDYIIIVAGVAGTTVVLSAIIIFAICIIFRQDRKHRPKNISSGVHKSPRSNGVFFKNLNVPENLSDDEKLRPGYEDEPSDGKHKMDSSDHKTGDFKQQSGDTLQSFRASQRRKEVSFAGSPKAHFVEGVDEVRLRTESGSPLAQVYRGSGSSFGQTGPEENGECFKQQIYLARQLDEVSSDTSVDTGTSDSGRGGSEDDVIIDQAINENEDKMALGLALKSLTSSQNRLMPPRTTRGDNHKPYHVRFESSPAAGSPRDSRSSKLYSNVPSFGSTSLRESPTYMSPSRTRQAPLSSPNIFRDSPFSEASFSPMASQTPKIALSTFTTARPTSFTFQKRSTSGASIDEEGSTTTSGSYTVNPEADLRMEGYVGSDVIV